MSLSGDPESTPHIPALYAGGGHTGGSYPRPPTGLQRARRQAVRRQPLAIPYSRIACAEYAEHVGAKRHAVGGREGERRYGWDATPTCYPTACW